MAALTPSVHAQTCALRVQVLGTDAAPVAATELGRLFPRICPQTPRYERLTRFPRVVVTSGASIVGLAVYHTVRGELRVPELALVAPAEAGVRDVLDLVLDALEAACLAGGSRRIVLTPPARSHGLLRRRGYELITEGCAGTWMEKSFQ